MNEVNNINVASIVTNRDSVITHGQTHKVTNQQVTGETLCGHDKQICRLNTWG